MPLDGLTLKALVNELNTRLRNGRILKIYQPTPHTVTLHIRLPGETQILLISAEAQGARLHTVEKQPTNPVSPPAFCMLLRKYVEPSRVIGIEQEGMDRIVHIKLEGLDFTGQASEYTLLVELLGRHSNIYLLDGSNTILDAVKRFPQAGIMPGAAYQPPPYQGKLEPDAISKDEFLTRLRLEPMGTKMWRWIQNTFQGFSKTAAQEVIRRAGLPEGVEREALAEQAWNDLYSAFKVLLAEIEDGGQPAYYPGESDFAAYRLLGKEAVDFTSTDQLITAVLGERSDKQRIKQLANSLKKRIDTHYKRVLRKEEIQRAELQEAKQAEDWRHLGELLTANFHLLRQGLREVEVADYTKEGQPLVRIELDPLVSPAVNVQRFFKKYRKAQASQKHTARQLKKTEMERNYLEGILLQLDMADSEEVLREIEIELAAEGYVKQRVKRQRSAKQELQEPARYRSRDGIVILVGRNNRQNDLVTFRLSSPRHLWLHARNMPGSHVVVLAEGEIPEQTLQDAARLAAYFSKGRESNSVPVDYTERRHVRKPKGAKPGFVTYEQAKTIFVNPTEAELPEKM